MSASGLLGSAYIARRNCKSSIVHTSLFRLCC
ncbi:hypothetical protein [Colwellia sp. TT2012]